MAESSPIVNACAKLFETYHCVSAPLAEGVRRQQAGLSFATIVYAHQQHVSIGRCVDDLALLALASTPNEAMGQIVYLPL